MNNIDIDRINELYHKSKSVVTMSGLSICITVNTTNAPIDKTEPKIKFPEILNLFFKLILLQKLVKYSATELAEILA